MRTSVNKAAEIQGVLMNNLITAGDMYIVINRFSGHKI